MNYKMWLGKNKLESAIVNSREPRIAVFAAKWCGFCKEFIELIERYTPSSPVSKLAVIDTDSGDGSLWDKYQIDMVPTIVVFRQGKEIFRQNGRSMRGLNQKTSRDCH